MACRTLDKVLLKPMNTHQSVYYRFVHAFKIKITIINIQRLSASHKSCNKSVLKIGANYCWIEQQRMNEIYNGSELHAFVIIDCGPHYYWGHRPTLSVWLGSVWLYQHQHVAKCVALLMVISNTNLLPTPLPILHLYDYVFGSIPYSIIHIVGRRQSEAIVCPIIHSH